MMKFSKQASALFCALLMMFGTATVAFASGSEYSDCFALKDSADVFSDTEFDALKQRLNEVGGETGWQMIVYASDDGVSSGEMERYYDNYYYGESAYEADAVMFVYDSGSDNRIILTYGSAANYFDGSRMDTIKSRVKSYAQDGDYYAASVAFADTALEFYNDGTVSGSENSEKDNNRLLYVLTRFGWIFGLVSLAAGGIFAGVNAGRYKYNGRSGTYDLNKNSTLNLLDRQDVFLNKHTTYTTVSSGSGSSGGASGGSSGGSSHSSGSF